MDLCRETAHGQWSDYKDPRIVGNSRVYLPQTNYSVVVMRRVGLMRRVCHSSLPKFNLNFNHNELHAKPHPDSSFDFHHLTELQHLFSISAHWRPESPVYIHRISGSTELCQIHNTNHDVVLGPFSRPLHCGPHLPGDFQTPLNLQST